MCYFQRVCNVWYGALGIKYVEYRYYIRCGYLLVPTFENSKVKAILLGWSLYFSSPRPMVKAGEGALEEKGSAFAATSFCTLNLMFVKSSLKSISIGALGKIPIAFCVGFQFIQ